MLEPLRRAGRDMAGDKQKRVERAERLAKALGLSPQELTILRRQMSVAESNLIGNSKAEKASIIARRLSITTPELKMLRAALMDPAGAVAVGTRVAASHIVGLASTPTSPVAPEQPPRRFSAPPRLFRDWSADTNAFLTNWGAAVHMYSDCSGMRGFRHADEPDPVVYQARLRDPECRDRRACRKCFDFWSSTAIDQLDDLLEGLHGKRRSAVQVARSRGLGQNSQATSTQNRPPNLKSSNSAKAERHRSDAAELGITIAELKMRRRAEHEANRLRKKK